MQAVPPGIMEWVHVVTTANKITLCRLLLIPFFLGYGIAYARGAAVGEPHEKYRYAAFVIFIVAALSDALDGWVARRFNQRSKLGAILDPLADKFLVVSATALIFFSHWPVALPWWFAVIVFAKEVFSSIGALVVKKQVGKVHIEPHWTGKAATFFVFVTITLALLAYSPALTILAVCSVFFACVSGTIYTLEARRQIHQAVSS